MRTCRIQLILAPMILLAATALCPIPLSAQDLTRPKQGDIRIGFALSDTGFCGIEANMAYSPAEGVWAGLAVRGSALILLRGDFDTGEAALTGEWVPDSRFDLRASGEVGLRFQNQNLGRFTTIFTTETFRAGLKGDRWNSGLSVTRRDSWLSRIEMSDWALSCFDDRYGDASRPSKTATILFPGGETRIGAYGEWGLPGKSRLSVAGGARIADTSLVSGFDGMMFGVFPFFADIEWSAGL